MGSGFPHLESGLWPVARNDIQKSFQAMTFMPRLSQTPTSYPHHPNSKLQLASMDPFDRERSSMPPWVYNDTVEEDRRNESPTHAASDRERPLTTPSQNASTMPPSAVAEREEIESPTNNGARFLIPEDSDFVPARPRLQPRQLPQVVLESALRRMGLSGTGTKAHLATRIAQAGFTECPRISQLASEWDDQRCVNPSLQVNAERSGGGRSRAPNWTKHETARLCHVIADARHQTSVHRMYQRAETMAELESGRHDPFAHEFLELFNSVDFKPGPPEPIAGVTDDILTQFDPTMHPHIRDGTKLKQRWTKLRSSYTTASENYRKSGQSDPNTFPSYTNGEDAVSYMHRVFANHPSLDSVLRSIPPSAQVEAGISSIDENRNAIPPNRMSVRKRRREDGIQSVAAAINKIAQTSSNPQPIMIQSSVAEATNSNETIKKLEESSKVASTVRSLMELKRDIQSQIYELESRNEDANLEERIYVLNKRVRRTRKMIDNAMLSTLEAEDWD